MTQAAIQRVLSCRSLPSLPSVALEVLELTQDPGVSADKLAAVLQNDPGLATKLLKTVNSSYYGLSQPCGSISKAVGLLGLNAVKSLALGFSLVDATNGTSQGGFDMSAYWRRAVYGAASAQLLAKKTATWDPDEAFVTALLQDIGMLAIRAAMREEYDAVLAEAGDDHSVLCDKERAKLGFDHAEIGAALAAQWRLPPRLVDATRSHHLHDQPNQAPLTQLARMAGLAALVIATAGGRSHLDTFREQMRKTYKLEPADTDSLIKHAVESGSQLSRLLKVNTGQKPDVAAILAEANERLAHAQEQMQRQVSTDALTGAFNRRHLDAEASRLLEQARAASKPLSVLFCDGDRFKAINDTHGHQAGDAVLVAIARRLKEVVGARGQVFRYGGEEFAILLPGFDALTAMAMAEKARRAIESQPVDVSSFKLKTAALPVTVSVGVATFDPATRSLFESATKLVSAADEAVYAAKRAGRNCVKEAGAGAAGPTGAAVNPISGPRAVLIVEGDALAAKLLEALLGRISGVKTTWIRTGDEALKILLRPGAPRPDLVIAEFRLGCVSGVDLTRAVRGSKVVGTVPVVLLACEDAASIAQQARAAGVTAFFHKSQIVGDMTAWVNQVLGFCQSQSPAQAPAPPAPIAATATPAPAPAPAPTQAPAQAKAA